MVLRVVVIASMIAASLVFVQQRNVLQNAGLVGYCTPVATPTGQTGHWHECRPGSLTGTPELSLASCTRAGKVGTAERWRCPTELERNKVRQ